MATLDLGLNDEKTHLEENDSVNHAAQSKRQSGVRLQFLLGENSLARLDKLQDRVEPSTRTEALRVALRVLESLIEELDNGNELLIRDKAGKLYPYKVYLAGVNTA